jgi:hypothetical protein
MESKDKESSYENAILSLDSFTSESNCITKIKNRHAIGAREFGWGTRITSDSSQFSL